MCRKWNARSDLWALASFPSLPPAPDQLVPGKRVDMRGTIVPESARFLCGYPLRPIVCPFCAGSEVKLLTGKVQFSAKVGGEPLATNESVSAFVCQQGHVFFLRDCDTVPGEGSVSEA